MRDFKYTVTEKDYIEKLPIRELIKREFNFSSRLRTKIKKNKSVFLNDTSVPWWITPKPGDKLLILLPDETSYFEPANVPIIPLFEDNDLLIINKPAGYVVHPTNGYTENTIANGVAQYMIDTNQSFKIRFINRLDMDTSGILVLGKNSYSQNDFVNQSKKNLVHKGYVAIVKGTIEEEDGTIDLPIGRPDPERVQRGVTKEGKPSVTRYKVLERYSKDYTLVSLKLDTGRTHQIRVHLSHIGHPIVGDELYGGEDLSLIKRQALHSNYLSFFHPVSKKKTEIHADLPNDMLNLIKKIK